MAVIKRNDDDGMYDDCAQISRVSARLKNLELTVVIFKLFFFSLSPHSTTERLGCKNNFKT